jgi:hypothetical protein
MGSDKGINKERAGLLDSNSWAMLTERGHCYMRQVSYADKSRRWANVDRGPPATSGRDLPDPEQADVGVPS